MERERERFSRSDDELFQRASRLEAALEDRERELEERKAKIRRLNDTIGALRADLRSNERRSEKRPSLGPPGGPYSTISAEEPSPNSVAKEEISARVVRELRGWKSRLDAYKVKIEVTMKEKDEEIARLRNEIEDLQTNWEESRL